MKSRKSIEELKKTLGEIEYCKPSLHIVGGDVWGCVDGFKNEDTEVCLEGADNSGNACCIAGFANWAGGF